MNVKPLHIALLVTGVALLAVGVTLAFTLQSHEPTQVPSQEYRWLPPTQTPPTQQQPEYKPPAPTYEPPAPTYEPPAPTYTPTSDTEEVLVYKVLECDKILILRENGEAYILENGIGCLSLDFYEGRRILIYSPGLFAGIGSKILLPDRDQQCQIWDTEFIEINIESRISGTFEGWDGDTIFELRNGQIWQQASYSYTYHYAYGPEVIIYSTNGGYKMMVDGVCKTIFVRRLK